MKRLIAILLAALTLPLAACAGTTAQKTETPTPQPQTALPTEETSETPTLVFYDEVYFDPSIELSEELEATVARLNVSMSREEVEEVLGKGEPGAYIRCYDYVPPVEEEWRFCWRQEDGTTLEVVFDPPIQKIETTYDLYFADDWDSEDRLTLDQLKEYSPILSVRLYEQDGHFKQLLPFRDLPFVSGKKIIAKTHSEEELDAVLTFDGTIYDFVERHGAGGGAYATSLSGMLTSTGKVLPVYEVLVCSDTRLAILPFDWHGNLMSGKKMRTLGPRYEDYHIEIGKTTERQIREVNPETLIWDEVSALVERKTVVYYSYNGDRIVIYYERVQKTADYIVTDAFAYNLFSKAYFYEQYGN